MEKNFTFRFYELSKNSQATPDLLDVIRKISDIPSATGREKQLAQDFVVRLETLEDDSADAIVGELTRCQGTNFPSEIDGDNRKALTAKSLGHGVVFRFNHKKGFLGIQYDQRVMTPGRLLEYVASFNANAIYSIAPIIDKKNWDRFNAGKTRKLSIRIANPEHMADLEGAANKSASAGIKAMGEAYGAPSIYVELSMGHHGGFLSEAINGLAKQLASMNVPGFRLDKLQAITVVNDESEPIDLIEERVVAKDSLNIDDRDPEKIYSVKKRYLIDEMKKLVG